MTNIFRIATLLTCHNRREKTISCLEALFDSELPTDFLMDVFLVDDGSTDGTKEAITLNFPQVNIIKGHGELFWNQGMRLAWESATKKMNYDFYLWLNDDTIIVKQAIVEILNNYYEAIEKGKKPVIICGACQTNFNSNIFSYGGRSDKGPVIPNGRLQMCDYINGNVVLIPKKIYNELGNLSPDYTHTMGDFDYGLRAKQKGFHSYTTKKYIAACQTNAGLQAWCDPENKLKKRWQSLHSPKGLNLKEYKIFRKKFWGWKWVIYAFKAYFKALMPRLYFSIKPTVRYKSPGHDFK